MPARLTRRRALARGLSALAGAALLPAFGRAVVVRQALAQADEPPADVPWPAPPPDGASGGPGLTVAPGPMEDDPDAVGDEDVAEPVEVVFAPPGTPPIKLTLPSLGVEAHIEPVGDDPEGYMSVPTNPDDVAWYQPGPGMGVPGNVVLAAHVNWDGRLRAFGQLHQLEPGDPILIIDAENKGYQYVVESSHWVRAEGAPVEEIFAATNDPTLTLITCGGEFVASRREYLDRLIVKAKGA